MTERGDYIPEEYLIEEVAGRPKEPQEMTEEQAYYLHWIIDPMVDSLIDSMEEEKGVSTWAEHWKRLEEKEIEERNRRLDEERRNK